MKTFDEYHYNKYISRKRVFKMEILVMETFGPYTEVQFSIATKRNTFESISCYESDKVLKTK